jgi:hypothetical protein
MSWAKIHLSRSLPICKLFKQTQQICPHARQLNATHVQFPHSTSHFNPCQKQNVAMSVKEFLRVIRQKDQQTLQIGAQNLQWVVVSSISPLSLLPPPPIPFLTFLSDFIPEVGPHGTPLPGPSRRRLFGETVHHPPPPVPNFEHGLFTQSSPSDDEAMPVPEWVESAFAGCPSSPHGSFSAPQYDSTLSKSSLLGLHKRTPSHAPGTDDAPVAAAPLLDMIENVGPLNMEQVLPLLSGQFPSQWEIESQFLLGPDDLIISGTAPSTLEEELARSPAKVSSDLASMHISPRPSPQKLPAAKVSSDLTSLHISPRPSPQKLPAAPQVHMPPPPTPPSRQQRGRPPKRRGRPRGRATRMSPIKDSNAPDDGTHQQAHVDSGNLPPPSRRPGRPPINRGRPSRRPNRGSQVDRSTRGEESSDNEASMHQDFQEPRRSRGRPSKRRGRPPGRGHSTPLPDPPSGQNIPVPSESSSSSRSSSRSRGRPPGRRGKANIGRKSRKAQSKDRSRRSSSSARSLTSMDSTTEEESPQLRGRPQRTHKKSRSNIGRVSNPAHLMRTQRATLLQSRMSNKESQLMLLHKICLLLLRNLLNGLLCNDVPGAHRFITQLPQRTS